jgi:hypothetical protein
MNTMTIPTEPDMIALARDVAALMPGWTLVAGTLAEDERRPTWAHIVHTVTGAELSLSLKLHPKRCIHVSGVWPRRKPNGAYGEFMPQETAPYWINVSADKTPAQVARDIARRLEGVYLAEHAVQLGRMNATLAGEAGAKGAADRIADVIGTTSVRATRQGGDTFDVSTYEIMGERRGSAELLVSPGGEGEPAYVRLNLRGITPDEAITIMRVLRGDIHATAIRALCEGGEA